MTEFERLYTGRVWSVMGWDQLTEFWKRIDPAAGWYLLAAGAAPQADRPTRPLLPVHRADRQTSPRRPPRVLLRHRLRR
jgi:hypothetical protein